jgi:hypothetical protein
MPESAQSNPIRMFTVVWGDHMSWFGRSMLRSLSWPKNRAALRGARWNIFTKKRDEDQVLDLVKPLDIPIEIQEIPDELTSSSKEMGAIILKCLHYVMLKCMREGQKLLMCPPDSLISEGGIATLNMLSQHGLACVAVPHPRVNPSIFSEITEGPMSGAELCGKAIKHLHKSWIDAEVNKPGQNTFIGGVNWYPIGEKMMAVQHRLPTIYMANFLPSDFAVFQRPHELFPSTFGFWDHVWPEKLVQQERLRVIGSSDACFICEVTKEDFNVPPQNFTNPFEPDSFWREMGHNKLNRAFFSVFRGE